MSSSPPPSNGGPGAPAKPSFTPYVKLMLALLCVATMFEGYDFYSLNLVAASLQKEFRIGEQDLFRNLGTLNFGMILAFFVVRAADRWGRKPVFLMCVTVYGLMSLLTFLIKDEAAFWAFQFIAKIFLVAEYGLASLIVSEEVPPERRGLGIGVVQLSAGIGAIVAALTAKQVLPSDLGWRGLYLIGALPLVLTIPIFLMIRETPYFASLQGAGKRGSVSLFAIWRSPGRRWIPPLGAVWFLCYLALAGLITTFPYYAEREMKLDPAQFLNKLALASVLGMAGYIVSGLAMDRLGRKVTAAVFCLGGAAGMFWAFHAPVSLMAPALIAANFFLLPLMPICATISAEMFPTHERADGNAWSHYLIGRWAYILSPAAIGWLAQPGMLGSFSAGVSLMALGPVIAAVIVLAALPERKGMALDKLEGQPEG